MLSTVCSKKHRLEPIQPQFWKIAKHRHAQMKILLVLIKKPRIQRDKGLSQYQFQKIKTNKMMQNFV